MSRRRLPANTLERLVSAKELCIKPFPTAASPLCVVARFTDPNYGGLYEGLASNLPAKCAEADCENFVDPRDIQCELIRCQDGDLCTFHLELHHESDADDRNEYRGDYD